MSSPTRTHEAQPRAARIDRALHRRGLWLSIVEGMSAQAQTSFTGLNAGGPNAITTGFAFLLGAQDPALGLLAALPVLGNVGHYVGAALAPRLSARRTTVAWVSTLARIAWLPIAFIPFLVGENRNLGLTIFLALWALTNALMTFSGNLWISWMADLVPPRIRGRYFSRRTRWTSVVAMLAPITLSAILDHWFGGVPSRGVPATDLQAKGFAIAFGAAAVFGGLCGLLLMASPEPPNRRIAEPLNLSWVLRPFRDRQFVPLLAFVSVFWFANGLSSPFWTPFQLEKMQLSYSYVNGICILLQGAAMILTLPIWGRIADRVGSRPVAAIAIAIICTHPFYYVIASSPSRWWLMLVDSTSSGISWAGYNLAWFNLVLALAPRESRELYVATNAVVLGVMQGIASTASGWLVGSLPPQLDFLGWTLAPYQQIFLVTGTARIACLGFFLAAVQEPRSKPIRVVVAAAQAFVKSRVEAFMALPRDEK